MTFRSVARFLFGAFTSLALAGMPLCGCTRPAKSPGNTEAPKDTTEVTRDAAESEGHLPLRRLSNTQYDNTVRDLLGDTTHPARDFPADDSSFGFDNMADVLTMPPLLVEKYDAAAAKLAEDTWHADYTPAFTARMEVESLPNTVGIAWETTLWQINVDGAVDATFEVPLSGEYTFSVRAGGTTVSDQIAPHMVFRVDTVQAGAFDVTGTATAPADYSVKLQLEKGRHTFSVALDNYLWSDTEGLERTLLLDWIKVDSPEHKVATNAARLRSCDPEIEGHLPCARKILERFAHRAFRRTVTTEEVDRLVALVAEDEGNGETFDTGIIDAVHAVLLSPNFLFRVELDPDPDSMAAHPVTDEELATRLSYFIWSSTPDNELLDLAAKGKLSSPEVLAKQVDRMLADTRADALVEDFAEQWLQLRAIPSRSEPALDQDIRDQATLFVRDFLRGDRNVLDLVNAHFTWLNDRLATYYSLPLPGSQSLARVDVTDPRRQGLLTQAGFLMLTSPPDHTSPVRRGKWVLGQLLCSEPPPPPPNVPPLTASAHPGLSKRQQLELHRSSPSCSGCHARMDPVGFALENFDTGGRWREKDELGFAVDATGTLPGGGAFNGPADLISLVRNDPALPGCIAQKAFTYGMSRGPRPSDRVPLDGIVSSFASHGYRFSDLVHLIVASEPFSRR